jgi:hypothetical protein
MSIAEALCCKPSFFFENDAGDDPEDGKLMRQEEELGVRGTDCITFKYSANGQTAEVTFPKDVDLRIMGKAIKDAAESVKGATVADSFVDGHAKRAALGGM